MINIYIKLLDQLESELPLYGCETLFRNVINEEKSHKIKKLINLTQSPNEHEAAAAHAKAVSLINQHGFVDFIKDKIGLISTIIAITDLANQIGDRSLKQYVDSIKFKFNEHGYPRFQPDFAKSVLKLNKMNYFPKINYALSDEGFCLIQSRADAISESILKGEYYTINPFFDFLFGKFRFDHIMYIALEYRARIIYDLILNKPLPIVAAPVVEEVAAPVVEEVAAPVEEVAAPMEEVAAPMEEVAAPVEEVEEVKVAAPINKESVKSHRVNWDRIIEIIINISKSNQSKTVSTGDITENDFKELCFLSKININTKNPRGAIRNKLFYKNQNLTFIKELNLRKINFKYDNNIFTFQ